MSNYNRSCGCTLKFVGGARRGGGQTLWDSSDCYTHGKRGRMSEGYGASGGIYSGSAGTVVAVFSTLLGAGAIWAMIDTGTFAEEIPGATIERQVEERYPDLTSLSCFPVRLQVGQESSCSGVLNGEDFRMDVPVVEGSNGPEIKPGEPKLY